MSRVLLEQGRQLKAEGASAFLQGSTVPNALVAAALGGAEAQVASGVVFGSLKVGAGDIVLMREIEGADACVVRACAMSDGVFWLLAEALLRTPSGVACSRWKLQASLGAWCPKQHVPQVYPRYAKT